MKEIMKFLDIDLTGYIFLLIFLILIIIFIYIVKAINDAKKDKMIKEMSMKIDEINSKLDKLIK